MSSAFDDEILSINAIYESDTLTKSPKSPGIYILKIPRNDTSLRVLFPFNYPYATPIIEGPEASGAGNKKGTATQLVELARHTLEKVFQLGEPCIYDLLEELSANLDQVDVQHVLQPTIQEPEAEYGSDPLTANESIENPPPWTVSTAISEKKSVFIARAAPVITVEQAKHFIRYLLENDKRVAKATHNITAWRIKGVASQTEDRNDFDLVFQDCDDDGETAAGGRLLHLLQMMDVWNLVVVVSRWYGGVQLGPDRFRLISTAARKAIVKGGFINQAPNSTKTSKK